MATESLAALMAEHPELPVLVNHWDDEPPVYVVRLLGTGTLGVYGCYCDKFFDDEDDLADVAEANGECEEDEGMAFAEALMRPCIWADWVWAGWGDE